MKFWDSSALVPLLVREGSTPALQSMARSDSDLVVWWGASIECASAIRRREGEGTLTAAKAGRALDDLDVLAAGWAEVVAGDRVRAEAIRAIAVHGLRAGDALQLAAALVWRTDPLDESDLVCLDDRLGMAASREGFRWLGPNGRVSP